MTSIFVAKLDFGVSSEQLKQLFEQHGKVLKANVATDRETGKSRGFGFVEMPDAGEANTAIRALDGYLVNGRPIAVKEAEVRTNTRPPGASRPYTPSDNQAPHSRDDGQEDKIISKSDFSLPSVDGLKIEPRKKVNKDKKIIDKDSDNRAKKPKMDAYKKSGKKSSFFDDDDDLDDDLLDYKRLDDNDDED
jgi:RNA recognition motif-containing protein